jgi:hypothetical protein
MAVMEQSSAQLEETIRLTQIPAHDGIAPLFKGA